MLSAANTLTDAANSLKQQRGQLPQYLLSDDIIVDLQAGLMWYRYVQAPDIAANAENFASNFELDSGNGVVYQDWHVATPAELELLQDRARFISTDLRNSFIPHDGSDSSYGNYGYSTQGLAGCYQKAVGEAFTSRRFALRPGFPQFSFLPAGSRGSV